ncbi:MAG: hypothetical protein OXD50_01585, partial [Chloroflexi bacterium]|nr:hypothetical protein [Chloroflexota bacterium]
MRLRRLRDLGEGVLVGGVEGEGERGVEESLASALHLVAQAHHVLERDLRLRGEALALSQGERLRRLEAHLLPLQRARGHRGRDRPEVEGEVHGRARRQQPLQDAGAERARPLAQVQGAGEVVAHPDLAAVELDRHLRVL